MAVAGDIRGPGALARRSEPWALLAWLLPIAVVLLAPLPTGDLAYQIRAGRLMLSTHEILRHDVFTYTFAGLPWVDQQWGAQVLFGWSFPLIGWRGFVVLRALLVGAAVGMTFERTRRAGSDPAVAGTLTIGAFFVAILVPGTTVLRPQLFAVILFVVAAGILQIRRVHRWPLLLLPVIGVLWANVHGSFVLLPLLVLTAAIDDVVEQQPTRRATVALVVVCSLAPLVNPWGSGIYPYVAHLTTSPTIRAAVEEWQPLYRQPGGLVLALASGVIAYLVLRIGSRRPTAGELTGWIAFTLLALLAGRNVIWWALYVPPVAGSSLAGWRPARGSAQDRTGLVLGAALVLLISVATVRVFALRPEALVTDAPAGVTAAVRDGTREGGRLFNGSWGSWFELALPNVPVFLDARGELTPDAVYHDYSTVMAALPGWQDLLNRWDVRVAAVPSDDPELTSALALDPDWTIRYQDADGTVFTRTA
jgi:hypothetical protein